MFLFPELRDDCMDDESAVVYLQGIGAKTSFFSNSVCVLNSFHESNEAFWNFLVFDKIFL